MEPRRCRRLTGAGNRTDRILAVEKLHPGAVAPGDTQVSEVPASAPAPISFVVAVPAVRGGACGAVAALCVQGGAGATMVLEGRLLDDAYSDFLAEGVAASHAPDFLYVRQPSLEGSPTLSRTLQLDQ